MPALVLTGKEDEEEDEEDAKEELAVVAHNPPQPRVPLHQGHGGNFATVVTTIYNLEYSRNVAFYFCS